MSAISTSTSGAELGAAAPATTSVIPGREAPWLVWLRTKLKGEREAVAFVLIAGVLLFIPFLGTLGLWDPWETHYGEVARAMIARDDYVYPYWESAYFFSKPAFPLWLMALGLYVTGAEGGLPTDPLGAWHEWGMRVPFALIAIATMWAVYRIASQLRDRATGVIAALVLASSAQFIFIGKQAMTDMPLVGLMTIALALFIAAVFDPEDDAPASRSFKIATIAGVALAVLPQLALIARENSKSPEILGIGAAAALCVAYLVMIGLRATRRDCWLAGFYTLMGLAALSKGLAVLAIVGPTVILYMLFTWDWALLKRCRLITGGVLFLLVASPWYVTLTLFKGRDDEGLTFAQRFWGHDNFARVGEGVHGDRAGLGYYIEQLAYGMFPWIAMIPFALGFAAKNVHEERDVQKRRALLFVLVWALWCYAFFTMSQTKFHHYIFPAVPALAILVALWFVHIAQDPATRLTRPLALIVLMLAAVAARDLINDPQNLVNLFTYKYDRPYPREMNARNWIIGIVALGAAGIVYAYMTKRIDRALLAFGLMACLFGAWISHHHFNMLSPHWSQAHMFTTFYEERKGDEPIYAYQLNWRGETYYSRNRILQVKEGGANERMRKLVDQPGREFIITEQSRFQALKSALSPDKRDKVQILDRSSNKFYLCVVDD